MAARQREGLRAALLLALVGLSAAELLRALEPPDLAGMEQIWPPSPPAPASADWAVPASTLLRAARAAKTVPYAQCLRNSGRVCEVVNGSSVVDYMQQCHTTADIAAGSQAVLQESEQCSAKIEGTGTCLCNPGWCADGSSKCVDKPNEILPGTYTITTQQYGEQQYLYMAPNGMVRLGIPPAYNQRLWRVAKTQDGVHHLYTLAYPQDLLDAWESCSSEQEKDPVTGVAAGLAWESCKSVVGHVAEPAAAETGWYIDAYDVGQGSGTPLTALRSKDTNRILYIDAISFMALSCGAGDQENCPGSHGALRFNPPLARTVLTTQPVSALYQNVHIALWGMILFCLAISCVCGLSGGKQASGASGVAR